MVFEKFSRFGTILSYHVFCNDNGVSLGHGFVVFLTREAANIAIYRNNGIELNGQTISVSKSMERNIK